jgi:purine-nucleoside phosphorylase
VYTRTDYEQAVAAIRQHTAVQPTIGIVLGSGLGGLATAVENAVAIPYETIPGWPRSTVVGHGGKLIVGTLEGKTVVCQQGRAHFYEGYSMAQVTFPIRVMHFLGVHTVILSNAAGGVNPSYRVADLMLLKDHINLPGMNGQSPLMGPNDDSLGPRFLGLTRAYDPELRRLARQVATEQELPLHEGVYTGLSGPTFETPAEVRMLRIWGTDAVGMSTVHEVVVARHMGMRVMACSGITNECIADSDALTDVNHEEVLVAGKLLVPRLTKLVQGVLRGL